MSTLPPALRPVKALFFDLLGTTLSWRDPVHLTLSSHGSHSEALSSRQPPLDWVQVAHDWDAAVSRVGRAVPPEKVPKGLLFEEVYMLALDDVCEKHGIGEDVWSREERAEILKGWWNLEAWPDTQAGVELLKTKYVVAGLTNGSAAWMTSLHKRLGVSLDLLLASDMTGAYKPNPQVYRRGMELLQVKPEECALVAAHSGDLEAARKQGMRTIYIARPTEDLAANVSESSHSFDLFIGEGGLVELARRLGIDA